MKKLCDTHDCCMSFSIERRPRSQGKVIQLYNKVGGKLHNLFSVCKPKICFVCYIFYNYALKLVDRGLKNCQCSGFSDILTPANLNLLT